MSNYFIDFWLFPRLGLARNYVERNGLMVSWPAAVGWFGSFAICFLLYAKDNYGFHLFDLTILRWGREREEREILVGWAGVDLTRFARG